MRRTIFLTFLVGVWGSVGCAGSFHSGEGFKTVKSKHITLYTDVPQQQYEATLNALEYSYSTLASGFYKGVSLGAPEVLLLEVADFEGLLGYQNRDSVAFASVPGGGKIGAKGLVVMKPDQGGSNGAEALSHLFLHAKAPNAPLWFHEGFSGWIRTRDYMAGDGQRAACFGRAGGKADTYIAIEDLLSASWDKYNDELKSWYHGTARWLIDFIVFGEGGKWRGGMGPLVAGIGEGQDSAALLTQTFGGMDQKALFTKIVEHANTVTATQQQSLRGVCPLPVPIVDEASPDISNDHPSEPTSAADIKAMATGLQKIPGLDSGWARWYPPEVIARAK